jgi:uncharacterized short protein YbdD (DUF466 family)
MYINIAITKITAVIREYLKLRIRVREYKGYTGEFKKESPDKPNSSVRQISILKEKENSLNN